MMIIYAIKNLEGNFYNRVHKEFRPLGQNTAFYKTSKLANEEKGFCLTRHLHTQYNKRKDKAKGVDYYKELDKYVKQHYKATDVYVVGLEIQECEDEYFMDK